MNITCGPNETIKIAVLTDASKPVAPGPAPVDAAGKPVTPKPGPEVSVTSGTATAEVASDGKSINLKTGPVGDSIISVRGVVNSAGQSETIHVHVVKGAKYESNGAVHGENRGLGLRLPNVKGSETSNPNPITPVTDDDDEPVTTKGRK